MQALFITGIGTGIGKTLVSAIVAEALGAAYWKPVQAGYTDGTDSEWMKNVLGDAEGRIHPEAYKLKMAASPHIAAREEGIKIDLDKIAQQLEQIRNKKYEVKQLTPNSGLPTPNSELVIEGAGGLLVPLNEKEFVIDLIKKLQTKVILVSRNYLGSINHSLLTAAICKHNGLPVAGWIFNDQYLQYEAEIVQWSGIPVVGSIPHLKNPDKQFISEQAKIIAPALQKILK